MDDIKHKILLHTFDIQQSFLKGTHPDRILKSILETIILLTNSEFGFIAKVTDTYLIPVATSGISCNKKNMDKEISLSDNFKSFMADLEESNADCVYEYLPISNGELIGLISSNALHKHDNFKDLFNPLVVVCKAALHKYMDNERIEIEKGSLISYIGHELKTSFTNVIGSVILLKKATSNKVKNEYLEIIDKSNTGLVSIINDTIDYANLLLKKFKLEYNQCNIKKIISKSIKILQDSLTQKNIFIIYEVEESISHIIETDCVRFQQIIINILFSILKIIECNRNIKIYVSKIDNQTIKLAINLNGGKINEIENVREKLRSKLELSKYDEHMRGSIDLQLQIAQKIAGLFDGFIEVPHNSNATEIINVTIKVDLNINCDVNDMKDIICGKKCIVLSNNFELRINLCMILEANGISCSTLTSIKELKYLLKKYKDTAIIFTDIKIDEFTNSNIIIDINKWDIVNNLTSNYINKIIKFNFNKDKPNINILVVDDNANTRLIITNFLNILGWNKYDTANSGNDAVIKASNTFYHIILMDINMLVMNGITAIKLINNKYMNFDEKPYMIALTTYPDELKFYSDIIDAYICKPITDINQMEEPLQTYLLKHKK